MRRVALWIAVGAVACLGIGGCVRFNTYYNASRAYREAETLAAQRAPGTSPSSAELSSLDRCLQKCAIIIARHPESSLADDALFLMARALSLKGQAAEAAEKYAELRRFFPKSDFVDPARYYEAEAHVQNQEYEIAEALIEEHLSITGPPDRWKKRAALLYAQIAERRGDCEEALRRSEQVLRGGDRQERTLALLLRGRCLSVLGRDEEASVAFHEADRIAPERTLRFEARLLRGETLARLGKGAESLEAFTRLKGLARADSELAQVGLAVGRCLRLMGDLEAAEGAWRDVILAYQRTTF